MLDHVSSGDFRLVQFRSDYITLGWFRTGYVRLCQVISGCLVTSVYMRLGQVRSG
jgi:hypothetical protein